MKLTLKLNKSIEQNASVYFEKAKKARKKLKGAKKALELSMKKLKTEEKVVIEKPKPKKITKKAWYEKFKWFFTSDNFLVVGGKDATTNEIVIKKHTEKGDLVFHTDMAGSPFGVIKAEKNKISETAKQETAEFVMAYSKAWKLGLTALEVFYVNPDQVTKQANPGEYLPKGAFMIRGKTHYLHPVISFAVGIYKDKIMGGPVSALKKHCKTIMELVPGKEKSSAVAKLIKKKLDWQGSLDDIIRVIPAGGCQIKK